MYRILIITISMLYSCIALAKSDYQIDLILFSHPQDASTNTEIERNSPLVPFNQNALLLEKDDTKSKKPYRLLPASQSSLSNEYYLLSRKSHYEVLGRYSWKQNANNQKKVTLPNLEHSKWQMQGTIQIKESNYYLFNAALHCSPSSDPDTSFTVVHKQRLKENTVYYLDHSQIGMLVKIHKIT